MVDGICYLCATVQLHLGAAVLELECIVLRCHSQQVVRQLGYHELHIQCNSIVALHTCNSRSHMRTSLRTVMESVRVWKKCRFLRVPAVLILHVLYFGSLGPRTSVSRPWCIKVHHVRLKHPESKTREVDDAHASIFVNGLLFASFSTAL